MGEGVKAAGKETNQQIGAGEEGKYKEVGNTVGTRSLRPPYPTHAHTCIPQPERHDNTRTTCAQDPQPHQPDNSRVSRFMTLYTEPYAPFPMGLIFRNWYFWRAANRPRMSTSFVNPVPGHQLKLHRRLLSSCGTICRRHCMRRSGKVMLGETMRAYRCSKWPWR